MKLPFLAMNLIDVRVVIPYADEVAYMAVKTSAGHA